MVISKHRLFLFYNPVETSFYPSWSFHDTVSNWNKSHWLLQALSLKFIGGKEAKNITGWSVLLYRTDERWEDSCCLFIFYLFYFLINLMRIKWRLETSAFDEQFWDLLKVQCLTYVCHVFGYRRTKKPKESFLATQTSCYAPNSKVSSRFLSTSRMFEQVEIRYALA